jgi:hypothetical protein
MVRCIPYQILGLLLPENALSDPGDGVCEQLPQSRVNGASLRQYTSPQAVVLWSKARIIWGRFLRLLSSRTWQECLTIR